jgi:tetratricopeptide (TPR) repeat protein
MDYELKPLSPEAIPEALEKAHRYRLLNEPSQAESICLDILHIEPDNQAALVTLLLAITDQFGADGTPARAREVLDRLSGEYERAYYSGMIFERSARVTMRRALPGTAFKAYDQFANAMKCYEKAEALRPSGNDDSVLRWNTCARTLMRHRELQPESVERLEPVLDD